MLCTIWYHLDDLKKVKKLMESFSRFLNCTNGAKSSKASQIV